MCVLFACVCVCVCVHEFITLGNSKVFSRIKRTNWQHLDLTQCD